MCKKAFLWIFGGILFGISSISLQAQCGFGDLVIVNVTATSGTGSFDEPATGDVSIEFCLNVDHFTENSTNWMHGIFIAWADIPNGFSVQKGSSGEQPAQHGNRNWVFFDVAAATNLNLPGPGYYVDDGDNNPKNNYGDNGFGSPIAYFPDLAPFCFIMTTACNIAPYNFRPKIVVTGDGTTGGWKNSACNGDRIIAYSTGPNDAGNVIVCGLVLPLKLISFNAKKATTGNLVYWSGIPDHLFSHFELESTTSLKNIFATLYKVKSLGTISNKLENHEYLDKTNEINTYYRLKMVDHDGSFTYSSIIYVNQKRTSKLNYIAFPNPTSDIINISFQSKLDADVKTMALYDLEGKSISIETLQLSKKDKLVSFSTSSLRKGIYFLEILENDKPLQYVKIVRN